MPPEEFENLDKYWPLYYKGEDGKYYELELENVEEILNSTENPFDDIVVEETGKGMWSVQLVMRGLSSYQVRAIIHYLNGIEIADVPIFKTDSIDEAMLVKDIVVASFRAKKVRKLTNCENGDIINIEIKNWEE